MNSICEECDAEYLGAGVWNCPDGCSLDIQRNEKKMVLTGENPCCRMGWQRDECEQDGDGAFLCPVCLEMLQEVGQP